MRSKGIESSVVSKRNASLAGMLFFKKLLKEGSMTDTDVFDDHNSDKPADSSKLKMKLSDDKDGEKW